MDASRSGTGARADDIPRRSTARVAGPAIAAGAVSLGLVVIGACGVQHQDVYVAPPPLRTDLQAAPVAVAVAVTTTDPKVIIPPSPTWRMADHLPILRGTSTTPRSGTSTAIPRPDRPPAENAGSVSPGPAPALAVPVTVAPVTIAPTTAGHPAPDSRHREPATDDLPHTTTGSGPGSDDLQIPSTGDDTSDATDATRPTPTGKRRDIERPELSTSTTPDADN